MPVRPDGVVTKKKAGLLVFWLFTSLASTSIAFRLSTTSISNSALARWDHHLDLHHHDHHLCNIVSVIVILICVITVSAILTTISNTCIFVQAFWSSSAIYQQRHWFCCNYFLVSCSIRVPLKPLARSASAFPAWTCLEEKLSNLAEKVRIKLVLRRDIVNVFALLHANQAHLSFPPPLFS